MQLLTQNNVFKRHLPYSQVYRVTHNPCRVTLLSIVSELRRKVHGGHGRLPFDQKFPNFRNGDKWYGNFLGKVPESPEIVEILKSEPFNRKFRDESQMERKCPGKIFRNFGYTSRGCPLFRKIICKSLNISKANKISGESVIFNF